jgi:hypothetical protein
MSNLGLTLMTFSPILALAFGWEAYFPAARQASEKSAAKSNFKVFFIAARSAVLLLRAQVHAHESVIIRAAKLRRSNADVYAWSL